MNEIERLQAEVDRLQAEVSALQHKHIDNARRRRANDTTWDEVKKRRADDDAEEASFADSLQAAFDRENERAKGE